MKFNEFVDNIKTYEPGKPIELIVRDFNIKKEDVIKLASNENPLGTSKKVQKSLKNASKYAYLYPDDSMYVLKDALAKKHNVKNENIIIGAGSDQIIEFIMHAKTNNNSAILTAGVTFAMYEIYAKQTEAKVYKTEKIEHDLSEFKKIYDLHKEEISVIFLCLPNNPIGECLNSKDIYNFIDTIDKNVLIVIDGAYNEFATFKDKNKEIKPKTILDKFENVVFLGTFSKLYGLGGMRIGYGIAPKTIIDVLGKIRPPFNVTTLSLVSATEALKDSDFVDRTLKNNIKELKKYEKFAKKNNIEYVDSYTNFITLFFKDDLDVNDICEKLLRLGIIVRNLNSYGLNAMRITIGTKKQNDIVLKAIKNIIK